MRHFKGSAFERDGLSWWLVCCMGAACIMHHNPHNKQHSERRGTAIGTLPRRSQCPSGTTYTPFGSRRCAAAEEAAAFWLVLSCKHNELISQGGVHGVACCFTCKFAQLTAVHYSFNYIFRTAITLSLRLHATPAAVFRLDPPCSRSRPSRPNCRPIWGVRHH